MKLFSNAITTFLAISSIAIISMYYSEQEDVCPGFIEFGAMTVLWLLLLLRFKGTYK